MIRLRPYGWEKGIRAGNLRKKQEINGYLQGIGKSGKRLSRTILDWGGWSVYVFRTDSRNNGEGEAETR